MNPYTIITVVNLSFFAIWGLIFTQLVNRPEYIPLFVTFQAAFNLLGAGIFFLDGKKQIMRAFFLGVGLTVLVAGTGYFLINKYRDLIRVEESY